MDSKSIKKVVDKYEGTENQFQAIVDFYCTKNKENIKKLATEFEVASSTVGKWRNGVAQPHSRMQTLIVNYINQKLKDEP